MNANLNLNENTLTFRVAGDLISTNAEALHREINDLLGAKQPVQAWQTFLLDLTAAAMIDSVGLNLIATILKNVQGRSAKMKINYSSPNVLRTLTFTRLDKYVELVKM